MAQTGYTPILIYSSSTASNTPLAANLTNSTLGSELAINITDGKLFYKDNGGAVQVIGWKTVPTSAGGTGLTIYTSGDTLYYSTGTTLSKLAIGASKTIMTSSGTAPQWSASLDTSQGGTGVTSYTAGDLIYYASGTTFTKVGIGTAYQALQVNAGGTAPSWQPSASSVMTTTGDLLYASAANTLARLADVATGNALISGGVGVAPSWGKIGLTTHVSGTLPTANGGTNLTSFTNRGVIYASSTSALATGNLLEFDGTNFGVGTSGNTINNRSVVYIPGATAGYFQVANGSTGLASTNGIRLGLTSGGASELYTVNGFTFYVDGTAGFSLDTSRNVSAGTDNNQTLGAAAKRWSTVYAGNGTINTSDANEKEQIADLTDAEKRVAKSIKSLIKKFKFKDAVQRKNDAARIHVGVIAQEVKQAFENESLDANKYGLFCLDTWHELTQITIEDEKEVENVVLVDAATPGAIQKTRLGVRYEQLLAFVIASL